MARFVRKNVTDSDGRTNRYDVFDIVELESDVDGTVTRQRVPDEQFNVPDPSNQRGSTITPAVTDIDVKIAAKQTEQNEADARFDAEKVRRDAIIADLNDIKTAMMVAGG